MPIEHAMPPSGQVEVLRPSNRKCALLFLTCAAFVIVGVVVVSRSHSTFDGFMGWSCIAFFGLGVATSLALLLPGSSFLRLSPEGMTVRSMWRTSFHRWSDIERFGVGHSGGALVCFDFAASYTGQESARAINRGLTGFDAALPDNYGRDHAELAAHINRWRERHAGARSPA
jgi:hypothetical protein